MSMAVELNPNIVKTLSIRGWDAQQILAGRLERLGKPDHPRQKRLPVGRVCVDLANAVYESPDPKDKDDIGKLVVELWVVSKGDYGPLTIAKTKEVALEIIQPLLDDARDMLRSRHLPKYPLEIVWNIKSDYNDSTTLEL